MTGAGWLHIGLMGVSLALFLLFCRLFYWRYFAEDRYYRRRPSGLSPDLVAGAARQASQEVPRFSIFVPARNEADVIEKTVDHLSRLRYFPERHEILVVTDEKERQAAERERQDLVSGLAPFLSGHNPWNGGERHTQVLTALLARLALSAADLAGRSLPIRELTALAPHQQQEILQETALDLASSKGKGRHALAHLAQSIRRHLPGAERDQIERLCPILLSIALPVVSAGAHLKREPSEKLLAQVIAEAAEARRPLTQKVLSALSQTISTRILDRLAAASPEEHATWLQEACVAALPTTQEIIARKQREFAGRTDMPRIKHVEVPWDFAGSVGGTCTGTMVLSTKGRALNYAFQYADPNAEMWGFYDAESRPHPDTLLYVAWRRLTEGPGFQLAQGPVFQIRNFWKIGPLCKIAGLFQAVSHEWQVPYLLRSIPVVGGTNIFAARDLMLRIGGFDHTMLSEDMELGVRAWLVGDAWPEFLPYASSEQTPPTFQAFFRQRLRWGSGYLQVYEKIKSDHSLPLRKKKPLLRTFWWKGQFSWIAFQLVALLPLAAVALRAADMLDPSAAPPLIRNLFFYFTPLYFLFTLYCFFHYYEHMEEASPARRWAGMTQLLALPLSAFFLPTPYSSALVLKWTGREIRNWVKTPRTRE